MDTKPSTQSVFKGFEGFSAPNTTPVPDVVFDVLAPDLSEAELRVLLYIIRRTFGFKKAADTISLGQMVHGIVRRDGTVLDRGTGLTKSGVTKALRGLLAKCVISARQNRSTEKGNEPTTYTLRFKTPLSTGEDKGLSTGEDKPLSTGVDTQDTVRQQTVLQSNGSKDNGKKTFDDVDDIKVETSASEAVVEARPPAREASATAAGAQPWRGGSDVTPIGHVLKQRVENWGRGEPPAQRRRGKSPPSTPTVKDHLDPLGGRSGTYAPGNEQEGIPTGTSPQTGASGSTTRRSSRLTKPSPQIEAIITQFSGEFHDLEHLDSNVNQAARLWAASGRSEQTFCQLLFDTASATRKQGGVRNKMAYFFRVLRDLLGLTEPGGVSRVSSPTRPEVNDTGVDSAIRGDG